MTPKETAAALVRHEKECAARHASVEARLSHVEDGLKALWGEFNAFRTEMRLYFAGLSVALLIVLAEVAL